MLQKTNDPWMEKAQSYIVCVSWLKLFWGATFWQYSASLLDGFHSGEVDLSYYLFRSAVVGLFDATACSAACLAGVLLYERRFAPQDFIDTYKLWLAALVVGAAWQAETDFAGFLAGGGWQFDNENFSPAAIIMNLVVYAVLHSLAFRWSCQALAAEWAETTIDLQVGFGGFGFYFAGLFVGKSWTYPLIALNAGFWTAVFSCIPAGFKLAQLRTRGTEETTPLVQSGTYQSFPKKRVEMESDAMQAL